MQRLLEIIFGLDKGFLNKEGELSLQFNPQWPLTHYLSAGVWNFLLVVLAISLVVFIYRREGHSRPARIILGALRAALFALVIALLNRPVLTLVQSQTEPSVVAVLVDDSISMRVHDTGAGSEGQPQSRLESVQRLLTAPDKALLANLAKKHTLRLYRFDRDAEAIGTVDGVKQDSATTTNPSQPAYDALAKLQPTGQSTQLIPSLLTALQDLQGQRLAGVVLLTDGRDTPARPVSEALARLKEFGVKLYPVAVGSDANPRNIAVTGMKVQDSAFSGDIVNVKATIDSTGFEPNHVVKVSLKDKSGQALRDPTGSDVTRDVTLTGNGPQEIELQFKADKAGRLDLLVEAAKQPGELDDADNISPPQQLDVLPARISVLFVDGYPRWEYRYIKNEMIRDATIDVSCLLTSADPTFAQEGDPPHDNFPGPIKRFPESIEELMAYDVILFGDVDPRQFTDNQLQLVSDFVSKHGGGFGLISGTHWAPAAYHNTAIEPILPVNIGRVEQDTGAPITQGFRPVLTKAGTASSIFRFFPDRDRNETFLRDEIQPIFWYCRGVTVKPGVGEVYAEHPSENAPDGRHAPLLVLGRFGAGRTLFSAIDDSWRWRYYTGESIFDSYWVQQVRYLARSKKLGQRKLTLTSNRPMYELGEQVKLSLRLLDPQLLSQLPDQLRVEVDDENGQAVRAENFVREEGQPDLYTAGFTADRVGRFSVKLPAVTGGVDPIEVPLEVATPRLELVDPRVDKVALSRLAAETLGQQVDFADAATKLPAMIQSAARTIPLQSSQPLWDAPVALVLFVLLITAEWVIRKMYGML